MPKVVAAEATENLMNPRAFAAMKRDAVVINLSRGKLVDEVALRRRSMPSRSRAPRWAVGAPSIRCHQLPSSALARRADVIATPHSPD